MSKEKDSFYQKEVKHIIYGNFLWFTSITIIIILVSVIVGSIGFVNETKLQYFLFVGPLFLLFYLILFVVGLTPRRYLKIKKLLDEKNESKLLEIANELNNYGALALCAIFELNSSKVRPILDMYLQKMNNEKGEIALINLLHGNVIKMESEETVDSLTKPEFKPIIPLAMTFFIEDKSELGKGMITKTQLTLDSEIVICPYCSNMAKKDSLSKWLKINKTCPICSSKLIIHDCPLVAIRDY